MQRLTIIMIALFTSCTNLSVTCVHTQGQAEDVVDHEQKPSTTSTVSPNISIPAGLTKGAGL